MKAVLSQASQRVVGEVKLLDRWRQMFGENIQEVVTEIQEVKASKSWRRT